MSAPEVAGPETADGLLSARKSTIGDAALVHQLYIRTPGYFDIISMPQPSLPETRTELAIALADDRRTVGLLLADPAEAGAGWDLLDDSGRAVVGMFDYKLDYPGAGDATVNLILIPAVLQSRGFGRRCVSYLEEHLAGTSTTRRLLAAIYGQNPRAERFWKSLGYSFAIDAKPNLEWYAKELTL